MKLPIKIIPKVIFEAYKLESIVHKGYVYIETRMGMYGLPQSGRISNNLLTERLARFGHTPCKHTPGLWKHAT